MKIDLKGAVLLLLCFCVSSVLMSQETAKEGDMNITKYDENSDLKMYVIERNVEGIGGSSVVDLQGITKSSCSVLHGMGNEDIQWVQSYFTGDKIYCIYKAKNKELIREHAETLGVPADVINEIKSFVYADQ